MKEGTSAPDSYHLHPKVSGGAPPQTESDRANALISDILREGLRHGFFRFSVSCSIGAKHRRQLLVESGKSYNFVILPDEVAK